MTPQSAIARVPAVALTLLFLAGCRTAHMPIPDDLSSTERMTVAGRQGRAEQPIRFGPYEARDVDRSWTKGDGFGLNEFSHERRRQTYVFTFRDDSAAPWRVSCEVGAHENTIDADVVEIEVEAASALRCDLVPEGGLTQTWTLQLAAERDQPPTGSLESKSQRLVVEGTRLLAGGLPYSETSGFQVFRDERVLSAVEVLGSGSVWLRSDLNPTERQVLASTAATLLLWDDLRSALENV